MVSAATGALLIPHIAGASGRATLLYGCYAMLGLSLLASLIIITMIWSRLAHYDPPGRLGYRRSGSSSARSGSRSPPPGSSELTRRSPSIRAWPRR